MPSPFPGMDPYLEDTVIWPDVHHGIISAIQESLNKQLRPNYYASVEERVYISDEDDPGREIFRVPDVRLIARQRVGKRGKNKSTVATLEITRPIEIVLADDEIREPYLEVVDAKNREVVTVIEVMSPSNKIAGSRGRDSYEKKRTEVKGSLSHWVEIDLLRVGVAFYSRKSLPPHDYLIHVSRAEAPRRRTQLWPVLLRERLPIMAIPLRAPDPDANLDLQHLLETAYDRASFDLRIDYRTDPVPPLTGENADWASQWLQSKGLR